MINNLKILGQIITTTVIIYFLFRKYPITNEIIFILFNHLEIVLITSFALFLLAIPVTYRWKLILENLKSGIFNTQELFSIVLIGLFFNQFLPSGFGGDIIRVYYAQKKTSLPKVAISIIVDRVLSLICLICLATIGLLVIVINTGDLTNKITAIILTVILISSLISCLLFHQSYKFVRSKIQENYKMPLTLILINSTKIISHISLITNKIILKSANNYKLLALSFSTLIMTSLIVYTLASAIDCPISLYTAIFLLPPALLIGMLPISLNGWGVREGAIVSLFSIGNVPPENSIVISILFGICQTISSLPGGCLWVVETYKNFKIAHPSLPM